MKAAVVYGVDGDRFVEVGRVVVDERGVAVSSTKRLAHFLEGYYVPDLDDPGRRRLPLEEGAKYVETLPKVLRGTYLFAQPLDGTS